MGGKCSIWKPKLCHFQSGQLNSRIRALPLVDGLDEGDRFIIWKRLEGILALLFEVAMINSE